MLVKPSKIVHEVYTATPEKSEKKEPLSMTENGSDFIFVDEPGEPLTKAIGKLEQGKTTHYYSYGNFNLVRLMLYVMSQTGPVHAFMTSYSFSQKSIEQIQRQRELKNLLSFRVIIDNRVRSLSPKPFQMLIESFDYRCSSIHAKVALLWNDKWNISIVTSQNATDNPKLERGTIFTDKSVFEFDLNALENEYNRGNL
ncbi:MAG: hypothetical protein HQ522_08990 [Bacteroidetes bacterium]|nr:hypothetical protein [Bacteroidota bacterium]